MPDNNQLFKPTLPPATKDVTAEVDKMVAECMLFADNAISMLTAKIKKFDDAKKERESKSNQNTGKAESAAAPSTTTPKLK